MIRFHSVILVLVLLSRTAQAGLVGYWDFDENVLDHSGNENHGELFGGSYVDDFPDAVGSGQALNFEDAGDHVFIDRDPSLNSSVFTLSMFVNDQKQFEGIDRFTSRESDTFETGIDKVFGSDSISYYSPAAGWTMTDFIPEIDAWHHLAYVADGEAMSIYADGDLVFGPQEFRANPTGFMHIGNRWSNVEGFLGIVDDVALWDVALPAESIIDLAGGMKSPPEIPISDLPPPLPKPFLSIGTDVETWTLSTESIDGGEQSDWDPTGDSAPPTADTFTLDPIPTTGDVVGHIEGVAAALQVTGIQADNDTRYYRTTFDLDRTVGINAEIQLAVDNGAQIFINGELVATETSFLVENWEFPLPSLSIAENGTVKATKFEETASSFDGWLAEGNEIILAVRNPFNENVPAGGFAFRLDFFASGLIGDFDHNEVLDATDIDLLNEQIRGDGNSEFDLNGDNSVDDADRDTMVFEVLNSYYGDANLSGVFDDGDFVDVFIAGEYVTGEPAGWAQGDWNGDFEFDEQDLVVAFIRGDYLKPARPAVGTVPEPNSLVLFVLGFVGHLRIRRDKF